MKSTSFIVKSILLGMLALGIAAITGCSGLTISAQTPYGDVSTDANGHFVIAPRPIIIPQK
jgi:hypothetical protein